MEAAIFYVCFVLFVVCVLASTWILYHGGKVMGHSDKLLDNVQMWVVRVLWLVAAVSLVVIGCTWPGGA